MHFSIISFRGGGLDLLESSRGCITYLVHHPTLEGLPTPE